MSRYESSAPRATLGLSAVAMAAISIGAQVVLPTSSDSASADPYSLAAAATATDARIESAGNVARSDGPGAASQQLPDGLGQIGSTDDPHPLQCFEQTLARLFAVTPARGPREPPARGPRRFERGPSAT